MYRTSLRLTGVFSVIIDREPDENPNVRYTLVGKSPLGTAADPKL